MGADGEIRRCLRVLEHDALAADGKSDLVRLRDLGELLVHPSRGDGTTADAGYHERRRERFIEKGSLEIDILEVELRDRLMNEPDVIQQGASKVMDFFF
jgi:hypothetical protein